ncbi:hypothetical protein JOF41_006977 [Saccharothrix coeruleofusca]|uniref:GSU2403 family nucleotidyltransferase fold protein n=1 Tax=Saccharothrix coeruleofusca TaxID=33919 RepID=UPI001AE9DBAB|nr:GSU2403 family nucleotidyltransferase fold protein [Saccharothrix coeruleofusca]MBP2340799.1 hypothetical protein [Saccharothrix coeruleofusca]
MTPAEYVVARSVLLDALDALGPHRDAAVLVGAQAVYLHSGDADLSTAPTTTDADLALTPSRLADEPLIGEAMRAAGFVPGGQPGTWLGRGRVAVDLMVPEALSGVGGRRGARLPGHGNRVARRTLGLEASVVDNEVHSITALDGVDTRSFRIRVAGPAALLVSKMIKIDERREQPHRLKPKDGLDVLRLLRTTDPARLARTLRELASSDLAGEVVRCAVAAMRHHGTDPDGVLPALAAAAEQGFEDADVIRMSTVTLVEDVLRELGRSTRAG